MPYEKKFENNLPNMNKVDNGRKIEPISEYYEVKGSDKREGIPVYGDKPLGGEKPSFGSGLQNTTESLRQEIGELEKLYKSSDYVGDKGEIEKRILSKEDELRGLGVLGDGKLKTAKELAMEGKIAWDKNIIDRLPEEDVSAAGSADKLSFMEVADVKTAVAEAGIGGSKAEIEEKTQEGAKGGEKIKTESELTEEMESAEEKGKEMARTKDKFYKKELPEGLVSEEEKKFLVYKLISKDMGAKKVPDGFEITAEMAGIEEAAESFIAQQKYFEEACKKLGESKTPGEKNEARIIRDNREKILKHSLDRLKMFVADKFAADKARILRESGEFSEKEIKKIINEEYVEYGARVILYLALPLEERIAQIKAESELSRREQGIFRSLLEKYAKLPPWKRLAVSCGISAGIGAGIVLVGTSGAIAVAAAYGTTRALRTFSGGALSAGLRYISDKIIGKKYKKAREFVLAERERETLKQLNEQSTKWTKESEDWMEDEKKKLELMRSIDESAAETNKLLHGVLDKERRARRWATIASGIIGGVTVLAASMDWGAFIGGKSPGIGSIVEGGTGRKSVPGVETFVEQRTVPKIIGPTPDQLQQATVGKGEGVEHVLKRQLESDPTAYGFRGSVNDVAELREWSGIRAHQIAIDEGYVNPKTGFETRVLDMGPEGPKGNSAYILGVDSSGKSSIREFFEGKPTGGKGVMNVYEYGYKRPSMSEILEQKKIETPVPAVEEMTARPVETSQAIPEPAAAEPVVMRPSGFGNVAAAVEAPTVGLSKAEIISSLKEDMQPVFESGAQNFDEFSLLKQEQLLNSQEMYDFEQYMRSLKGMPNLTDADAELMGEMNKYWSQMAGAYSENLKEFSGVVHEATGLVSEKGVDVFLNTKIGSVWDSYRGDGQILDFVKSVNPTSDELVRQLTVGEILKSRFLGGEFAETKIAGAPGWVE